MNLRTRLDRLEQAAPRPVEICHRVGADALAADMVEWVSDNRALDTYDGQSARAFVEALAELGMEWTP